MALRRVIWSPWLWLMPAGVFLVFFFYYFTWLPDAPLLDGDEAVYQLMADYFSPFAGSSDEVSALAMRHSLFPPLYPLLIGLFGGTTAHVGLAHALTTTFLLGALAVFFLWIREQLTHIDLAGLLTVAFALLPVTLFQSLGVLSENLYLLLTLSALLAAARSSGDDRWQYMAAFAIGLAAATRSIGLTLVLAYLAHLYIRRSQRYWPFMVLALAPLLIWTFWKYAQGYHGSYASSWYTSFGNASLFDTLVLQVVTAIKLLWTGWAISFDESPTVSAIVVIATLLVICLSGMLYRLWRGELDAIYVAIYLLVIVAWPYHYEARRFLYVVLPILLFQGVHLIQFTLRTTRWSVVRTWAPHACVLAIMITVYPAVGLIVERLWQAREPTLRPYANTVSWYAYTDRQRAIERASEQNRVVRAWKGLSAFVPAGECVYHIKPVPLALHANRLSYITPYVTHDDSQRFLHEATQCRYFYLGAFSYYPYNEPFYPQRYLRGVTKVVAVDRLSDAPGAPVLGMLVERTDWSKLEPTTKDSNIH